MLKNGNNPPLHFIILHFWIKLFGISAFSVRMPSLIFSVLTAFFVYETGRKFFNIRIAVFASLLFTLSNYNQLFAHEARMYSLFELLSVVSMYAFLSLIKNPKSRKFIILFTVSNILLIFSHFFGFFIIIVQIISCVIIKDFRVKVLKVYSISLLIVFISYLPYLKIFISRFYASSQGTWVEASDFQSSYEMIVGFSNAPVIATFFILILLAAFGKLIYRKEFMQTSVSARINAVWFIFPFFFMYFISLKYLPFNIPMFLDRYLVFISVAFYFIVALAVDYLFKPKKITLSLFGILIFLMAFTFQPDVDNLRQAKDAVLKVKELKTPGSVVLICPPFFSYNFGYYYNSEYFKNKDLSDHLIKDSVYCIYNIGQVDEAILKSASKIIYLDAGADFSVPDNNIVHCLSKDYKLLSSTEYYQIFKVYEFRK
jgi:uncharacterized membrane protein